MLYFACCIIIYKSYFCLEDVNVRGFVIYIDMNLFLKVKSIVGVMLGVLFAYAFICEAYSVLENSKGYYYISSESKEWQYQSVDNYHTWCLICGGIALLYVGLNVLSLSTKKVRIKYTVLAIDILLLLLGIIGFYNFAVLGFDS